MNEFLPAVITVARALTIDSPVYVIGAVRPPQRGWRELPVAGAETKLRSEAVSGGVLVVAGDFDGDFVARDRVLQRSAVWGLAAVWLGDSARPGAGLATCIETTDADAAIASLGAVAEIFVGDETALAPSVVECTEQVCVTCSDEGRLGEVVRIPAGRFLPAVVRTATGEEDVDVTLVGDVAPGDLVLIHAGGAIARVPDPIPEVTR